MCRHVVASVDDQTAGPSYSVPALSDALRAQGVDSAVLSVGRRGPGDAIRMFPKDLAGVPVLKRLMFSRSLERAVDTAAEQGVVLHGHGLWLMPNVYPARAARRHDVPLLVSPRGMLSKEALAFSISRKRIMWMLAQRRALEAVHCFHATSEAEGVDIRRAGLTAPVVVIPNGVDIPESGSTPHRTVLCLGRLHPKKGIDELVAAWARIAERFPDWRLRIVGPSEIGCRETLEAQVRELRAPRVDFDGPLVGPEKWAAYREAGLFVLPTRNENFGMVVAEALAAGVPSISTKGAPWAQLETERCGWWIDQGAEAMAVTLDGALRLPTEVLAEMGQRGRAWMRRDFGWDRIAERMAGVYEWCAYGGERPDCVVT